MWESVRWWLVFEALGLMVFPLCARVFRPFPDRGYALSKISGLLLAGWLAWLAASVHFVPFSLHTDFAAVAVMGALSVPLLIWAGWRAIMETLRSVWPYAFVIEVVFAASFAALTLLRAHMPEISATEKPMEFMLLRTVLDSGSMPPRDLWMSGNPVNYYYFGYVLNGFVTQLSDVPPDIAFNLAIASTWALTFTALVGLGYGALAAMGTRIWRRVLGGLLAPLLVLIIGNPAGTVLTMHYITQHLPFDFNLFWAPSRVIHDQMPGRKGPQEMIDEFPAFSYLLGDLHPHVLAMPLFSLGLALSLAAVLACGESWRYTLGLGAVCGAVLGWLYMTNTWDTPAIALVFILALLVRHARFELRNLAALVPMLLVAVAVSLPFLLRYHAPVNAGNFLPEPLASVPVLSRLGHVIGIVTWDHTSVGEFLRMWGIQSLIVTAALVARGRNLLRQDLVKLGVFALIALVVAIPLKAPVLMMLPLAALCITVATRERNLAARWGFILVGLAAFLVFVPEVIYLRDAFESRMNTIFKFYFQAWQVLGIACAVLVASLTWRVAARTARRAAAGGSLALIGLALVVSLAYPYAAMQARNEGAKGLDGLAFLREGADPNAYEAIQWLDRHSRPGDVVLEGVDGDYTLYARISTYSGRPTVMGWPGHEDQWRPGEPDIYSEIGVRLSDVQTLYGDATVARKRELLRKYRVRYVYYGDLERQMQAEKKLPVVDSFQSFLTSVARFGDSVLYKVT